MHFIGDTSRATQATTISHCCCIYHHHQYDSTYSTTISSAHSQPYLKLSLVFLSSLGRGNPHFTPFNSEILYCSTREQVKKGMRTHYRVPGKPQRRVAIPAVEYYGLFSLCPPPPPSSVIFSPEHSLTRKSVGAQRVPVLAPKVWCPDVVFSVRWGVSHIVS